MSKSLFACVIVMSLAGTAVTGRAEGPGIGLLVAQRPGEKLSVESDMAREVAQRLLGAVPVWAAGGGRFVDREDRDVTLERFAAVWCHQGEAAEPAGTIGEPDTLAALRRYVESGHGLLLSGTAAGLVGPLDLDTLRTQPVTFGHDRAQAGLLPVAEHPALRGLDLDRGVLWMSNAVYPAFAQFHPAGTPPRAVVLARTPGGAENPLVEYHAGQGRAIALAWRLSPHYPIAPPDLRANFERLLGNLVAYLADPQQWPRASGTPTRAAAGVAPQEWQAVELAIDDLCRTFPDRYPRGPEFRRKLDELKRTHDEWLAKAAGPEKDAALAAAAGEFRRLRSEALLANPLLDFDKLLLVKRGAAKLGLPTNYQSNCSLPPTGYDNEIAVLSPVRPGGRLTTLFRPAGGRFVGDVDLHFDADRLLFSMPGENGRWQIGEIRTDGTGLRELPLIHAPDVDNYDACYLPDGRIVFTSTAPMVGVPCVRGSAHVANLYLLRTDGSIRQLTAEQDHDWCPTVLPSGRVLYLRWEYADIPHAFSRILMSMNPDGTGQMEQYGSNSYWPASTFFARPVPGHATKLVAVVGGHHELPRMGDLVVFDTARGRFEADGAVQRIPGRGRKVEPVLLDLPIAQNWPKFLHPWPLGEKYFLAACQPGPGEPWGVWLVDIFDNMVPIYAEPGYAMLEPVPLRAAPRPPVLPDRADPARHDAEVFLADVYAGPGLRGVPRGTIKSLRVVGYQFAYQGVGGEPDAPGLDGPWDVKRIVGTVPVCEDGSAHFRVPACTPLAVQPLDAEGKAVQLMRSWFTAMPGEVLSCVGCHESTRTTPTPKAALAATRPADEIRPWHGPARGFDFRREVQPVLDRHCLACHDGRAPSGGAAGPGDTFTPPDLADRPAVPTLANKNSYNLASRFTPSYYALRKLVRTPTRESDMHLLMPYEYHADTTRLVQMLEKGHHGVQLDPESRDRLVTWIDLNATAHGTWTEICGPDRVAQQRSRRHELRKLYAGQDEDPEAVSAPYQPPADDPRVPRSDDPRVPRSDDARVPRAARPPVRPEHGQASCPCHPEWETAPTIAGWPFDAAEAKRRQESAGPPTHSVPLAPGISLDMVRIPAGQLVMGQADGEEDERPLTAVSIDRPFWMGRFEITNEQFALFDPSHQSGLEYGDYIQFSPGERGWTLSRTKQPVVRVSWRRAMAFCRWLSAKTGRTFDLPTEAQWEYACRAGTATPFWYGTADTDFSASANLSDATHQAIDPFGWAGRVEVIPPWRPADVRFNDHSRVSAPVGSYLPNPWGLFDMHGNVAEWTRTTYRPYPYDPADGRDSDPSGVKKVVRGGSWYDPPTRCRSAFRQAHHADQGVYDVGFRVICAGPAAGRRE